MGARVGTEEAEPNGTEQRVESSRRRRAADLIKNTGDGARRLLSTLHSFALERREVDVRCVRRSHLYSFPASETCQKVFRLSNIVAPSKAAALAHLRINYRERILIK